MRRLLVFVIAALSLPAGRADVLTIVNQVRLDSYRAFLDNQLYTHNGDSRGPAGPQHDPARTNIYNIFSSYGLTTSLDPFTYGGSTYYNVTAILPGRVNPNSYLILGAHYDSANNPGADDDASGVAGLLEAARVLSSYAFASTLVFAAFDLEELGLLGSAAWAGSAKYAGATIAGMLELDMIAYNPGAANTARMYTVSGTHNAASLALAASIAAYSGGLTPAGLGATNRSDHASFDSRGPSVLLIESSWGTNPYYHRVADSVDTANYIDYAYATGMTRAAVGWMAMQAGEVPEPAALALVSAGLLFLLAFRRSRGSGR